MTNLPHSAVVWAEIPVTDMDRSGAFYAEVTGYPLKPETGGPNPILNFGYQETSGTSGHIYPGKPAAAGTGPTVHLGIRGTVEDAIARCTKAGGKVVSPVITIPPGRFAYALDLDGNSIGLFEPAA
jgi:uncharacterized protein